LVREVLENLHVTHVAQAVARLLVLTHQPNITEPAVCVQVKVVFVPYLRALVSQGFSWAHSLADVDEIALVLGLVLVAATHSKGTPVGEVCAVHATHVATVRASRAQLVFVGMLEEHSVVFVSKFTAASPMLARPMHVPMLACCFYLRASHTVLAFGHMQVA
jgi:hypothetical protein